MENAVKSRLQTVQFGEPQSFKNIAIVPLIAPVDGKFQYRTLGEALACWDVAISEVSAAGSVPELMVVNRGNNPVLLIDGEELAGAKQNRVLNTSILLKEVSETKIPVSCTEQGRWSYASKAFSESGNVMAYKSRSRKTRSVHSSLESCGAPMSDQGEVWDGIAELQAKACAPSPTAAMSDVYKSREEDLGKCAEIFKPVPGQVGLVAFIGGKPAGMDMVSLALAYPPGDAAAVSFDEEAAGWWRGKVLDAHTLLLVAPAISPELFLWENAVESLLVALQVSLGVGEPAVAVAGQGDGEVIASQFSELVKLELACPDLEEAPECLYLEDRSPSAGREGFVHRHLAEILFRGPEFSALRVVCAQGGEQGGPVEGRHWILEHPKAQPLDPFGLVQLPEVQQCFHGKHQVGGVLRPGWQEVVCRLPIVESVVEAEHVAADGAFVAWREACMG